MCGIVGYVGKRPVQDLLLEGLTRLEYRGYDSAGISMIAGDAIDSVRAVGNLEHLRDAVSARVDEESGGVATATRTATTGIGHTRWATHGRVNEENAHPHFDTADRVHIVVNGIVENYLSMRERLTDMGAVFTSETDAEVIAHLIAHHLATGSLLEAVRAAYAELEGHYAFVAMSLDEPETLVGARKECPLIVGRGEGETFFASAIPAFLRETRRSSTSRTARSSRSRPRARPSCCPTAPSSSARSSRSTGTRRPPRRAASRPSCSRRSTSRPTRWPRRSPTAPSAPTASTSTTWAPSTRHLLRDVKRIIVVACGTSYHAGLIGRYAIEEWARIPVEMDIASEYRYRNPVVGPGDLVIGITQSGETADTLAAMRIARERGATVLALTNIMGSQATRDADGVLYTRAGLEVCVAATKTFTCQVVVMFLLGLKLAELRDTLPAERRAEIIADLKRIPHCIEELLGNVDAQVQEIADAHWDKDFFLYLGRHVGLPVALEGALKLKEISYISTDAYAAGEMKHGPIALLDESTPVVTVATDSPVLEKVVSNMQEVRARGAHVIAIASEGNQAIGEHAESVVRIPRTDWMLQPLLAVIPLQLLAYRIARRRGLNVDQPRNLAKTVTVE